MISTQVYKSNLFRIPASWEENYTQELKNFRDHGIVGEVWFGEDSMIRIIRWMEDSDEVQPEDGVLDLGCGNGMMLIELARYGFSDLTGIDYSHKAIDLAVQVAEQQKVKVKYEVCNLLDELPSKTSMALSMRYSICIDKGTYDAISLCPDAAAIKRCKYLMNVYTLLKQDGMLILTSCNWTLQELACQFQEKFYLHHVVPTPTFNFGGKVGNLVTTVVLRRR